MNYPEKRIVYRDIMFVANPAGMSHEKNPSGFFAVVRVKRPEL